MQCPQTSPRLGHMLKSPTQAVELLLRSGVKRQQTVVQGTGIQLVMSGCSCVSEELSSEFTKTKSLGSDDNLKLLGFPEVCCLCRRRSCCCCCGGGGCCLGLSPVTQ